MLGSSYRVAEAALAICDTRETLIELLSNACLLFDGREYDRCREEPSAGDVNHPGTMALGVESAQRVLKRVVVKPRVDVTLHLEDVLVQHRLRSRPLEH